MFSRRYLTACDYLVESTQGKHIQTILHFIDGNCVNLACDNGKVRLNTDPAISQQSEASSYLLEDNLELVDTGEMATTQPNRV